ncbi:MAG: hypothetical protein ACJ8GO_20640 [Ramlibacter sp.]|jgi:hypothetical protein
MHLPVLTRRAWQGLLAALPPQVLRWLDGWASRQAQARAARRRRALQAPRPRA